MVGGWELGWVGVLKTGQAEGQTHGNRNEVFCDVIKEIHLNTELNGTSRIWAKWPDIFTFYVVFLGGTGSPGTHSRAF